MTKNGNTETSYYQKNPKIYMKYILTNAKEVYHGCA